MPVWLMRQAGRYLPEYRALRSEAGSFLKLCLNPDHATEITLQPIRRFGFDAAILFADILLIPMALGRSLEFREGEGPVLGVIEGQGDIDRLSYDDTKLQPVYETVRRVKKELPKETALIGFCGAPFTVAAYMIDGHSRNNFSATKEWMARKPQLLQNLIDQLIDASEKYLSAQIDAGAEVLQIFDSWAGLALEGDSFQRWIIAPTKELVRRMRAKYPHIPIISFPREAGPFYADFAAEAGVQGMSIDFNVDLNTAKAWQKHLPLQGNLDPALLVKGGTDMQIAVQAIINTLGPKHIFNLGHGVVPQTPPEHVGELVKIIRGEA